MTALGLVIELLCFLALTLLLIRLVVDWIQMFARSWTPRGPLLVVLEGVYSLTDPPVKALRRMIPPLRLGGISLDLSFLLLILVVYLVRALNTALLL